MPDINPDEAILLGQDDKFYRVYHPQRGQIKISKEGLGEDTHGFIRKMQKFDDGGEVLAEDDPELIAREIASAPKIEKSPYAMAAEKKAAAAEIERQDAVRKEEEASILAGEASQLKNIEDSKAAQRQGLIDRGLIKAPTTDVMPQAEEQSPAIQPVMFPNAGTQQPQEDAYAQPTAYDGLDKIYQDAMNINTNAARADAAASTAMADAYANQVQEEQKLIKPLIDEKMKLSEQAANLKTQIANGKIDPTHFWSSKSMWAKMGTVISVGLSGFGAGLLGQENSALKMIEKQINDDIEAQKANLANKNSLLSKNLEQTKDLDTAINLTRSQLASITQGKIAQMAAQSKSSQAMYNAQMLNNGIQAKLEEHHLKTAIERNKGIMTMRGIPVGKEPAMLLSDPEYLKKRIVSNGAAYQANSDEGANKIRELEPLYSGIVEDLNILKTLGPKAAVIKTDANEEAKAVMSRLGKKIALFSNSNKFSDFDAKMIEKQYSNPTHLKALLGGSQVETESLLKSLHNSLEREKAANLRGYKPNVFRSQKKGW